MKHPFFRNVRLISLVQSHPNGCIQISRRVSAAAGKYYVRRDVVMDKKIEKNCRNRIFGFLVILLFILPLTIGAEEIIIQGEQTASKTAKEKLKTRVTISSTNTPIEEVLMDLADQAKIDIIKSPKVTGNVTVKVTDVPLEEALTNILAVYNCTYIATENMVRVVPLPEMGPDVKEPQVTRIYKITYADVEDVAVALGKFVSGKAEVGINKGTSHIIVTDTEDKIKALDKFIEQVDVMTSQVLVEVRIYDVTTNEGFELSPDWHVGRNAPYTADTILLPADEVTETEVGPERNTFHEDGTELEEAWLYPWPEPEGWYDDRRNTSTQDRTGWDLGRTETEAVYDKPPLIMSNWRRREFGGGSFDRITGGTLSFSVLNDAIDVDLALTILHSQVEARLLANPRILVLDNETAKFEIVREIPYRELLQVTREDPMSYTDFKKVGVDLQVTPHIARDGMMRLKIEPKFSVLVGQDMYGVPTVDARRLETTAMIKDGQTIAIGGLRKREVTKDVARVPVLSDIPLLGGLFKSETESVIINELVVFITSTIITELTLSESEKKLLDKTEFTTPSFEKTRIEKGEFKKAKVEKTKSEKTESEKTESEKTEVEKTEVEKTESEKTEVEKRDIAETLDLLLKKLGPSPD